MASLVKIEALPELGLEEPNRLHIQESLLRQVAHGSPLTAKKKRKSDVRASSAKIYRQKGTGRARQGERTNPHFVGGGLAFPPTPRVNRKGLNKMVRRSALRSAVLWHVQAGSAWRIEGSDFEAFAKTQQVAKLIEGLKKTGTVTLVVPNGSTVQRSSRNIAAVRLITPQRINVRDLVESKNLVFADSALEEYRKILELQNTPEEALPVETVEGGEE